MYKSDTILLCEKVLDATGRGYQNRVPFYIIQAFHPTSALVTTCSLSFYSPLYTPYQYIITLATEEEDSTMGIQGSEQIDVSSLTIQKALDIVRNSEESVDPVVSDYLESQLREIWDRIEAEPESYILNKDEFALFNYNIRRAPSSSLAQSAVQRFWDNYSNQQNS
jgi:hypothetical protein